MHNKLPSEEIQILLKEVVTHFDKEDRAVRERQIRQWRRLKFYWDGITNIWYSSIAHDWKVWDQQAYDQSYGDSNYYDKRINLFKSYLESIIAALSVSIPQIKCSPEDADNPLDNSTAKAGDKISELISKHNASDLLWLHALYIYCTEGMIAGYIYPKEDEKYGTYEDPIYEDQEKESILCPECGESLDSANFDDNIPELEGEIPFSVQCPHCESEIPSEIPPTTLKIPVKIGTNKKAKSRVCIEAFGGLFVKVSNYAKKQEDCNYLIFAQEVHYANIRERYEHLADKKFDNLGPGSGGIYDPYERWGRLPTQYYGEYPTNVVTVRCAWLRPTAFHILDADKAKELKELYPKGVKVVLVNDEFAEAFEEELDARWQLSYNPLADYIHHQPLGELLTSMQDIVNEVISLTLQTIEHGIPQTFADPGVLNFDGYKQTEVAPGMIFPATPKSGKSVGEAFYEIKTATLSTEVLPFGESIQQLGQVSSGALPSLSGGAQPGSSKTAAEYSMSKNQAMQRLQNHWKILSEWWKDCMSVAIPLFMEEMVEDEKFTKKDALGNFTNVFIRKAELEGKIGEIELDAAENLPLSWMQKKDTIMQFLQAANPIVMEALTSPENLPTLADAVGLSNIKLPGMDDRQKQYEEIQALVNSTPMPIPEEQLMQEFMATGVPPQEIEEPSVPIEVDVDNHEVHIQIAKGWLVSEAGRLCKIENPEGYKNVLLHLKQHMMFLQSMMMQAAPLGNEEGGSNPPQNDKTAAPVGKQNEAMV